ncbi:TPA: hypothetical protein F6V63_24195 [Escherichia coli]|nr:hypothetical protein [Escherichia coli]
MTSLKTSIKTITYLSDTGCLEIQGASLARNIATIATRRDYQMGRKLAGSLMKEQGLVSCQPLTLRYRHGSHELVAILRT